MLISSDTAEHRRMGKKLISSGKSELAGRLSANLLHELNNSLDGVHRYVRLLLDQIPGDDPRRMYAEHARDGLMRMANMVRELLGSTRGGISGPTQIDIPQSITWTLSTYPSIMPPFITTDSGIPLMV